VSAVSGEREFTEAVAEAIWAADFHDESTWSAIKPGRKLKYRVLAEAAVAVMVERLGPPF